MTMEQGNVKTPCDYVTSAKKSVMEKLKTACKAIAKCLKDCYADIAESYKEERSTAGAEAPSESAAAVADRRDEAMPAAEQAEKTEEVKEEPEPSEKAVSESIPSVDESISAAEQTEKTEEIKSGSVAKNKIKFKYYNPKAKEVKLTGDFNSWRLRSMAKGKDGIWVVVVDLAPGRYAYKYVVDGQYIKDNKNPKSEPDGYGGERSVLEVKAVQ